MTTITWIQALFYTLAILGGGVAVTKALVEIRENRQQREKDLRWRQALQAKAVIDELRADERACCAMLMLDWSGRDFDLGNGTRAEISQEDVRVGLGVENRKDFTRKDVFIRDCFDRLFDGLERIESFIQSELILFEDVRYIVSFHVGRMKGHSDVIEAFLHHYEYRNALAFLHRFDTWTSESWIPQRLASSMLEPETGLLVDDGPENR